MAPGADPIPDLEATDDHVSTLVDDHAGQGDEAEPASEQSDEDALATQSMLARFEKEQSCVDHPWLFDAFQQMNDDAEYVHTGTQQKDTKDSVPVNMILVNQQILVSQAYSKDPDLSVRPRPQVPAPTEPQAMCPQCQWQGNEPQPQLGPMGPIPPTCPQCSAQVIPLPPAPDTQAQAAPFGKTVEIIVKHYLDQMRTRALLKGGIQDASTRAIQWYKLVLIEDKGRDPLGTFRPSSLKEKIDRLDTLQSLQEADGDDETNSRAAEIAALKDVIKRAIEAEAWKQISAGQDTRSLSYALGQAEAPPQEFEIPAFRGFELHPINPVDFRQELDQTRPELFRRCKWLANRVYMSAEDIQTNYGVNVKDLASQKPSVDGVLTTTGDPRVPGAGVNSATQVEDADDRSTPDAAMKNGLYAVWERSDRELGTIFTWVQGKTTLLAKQVPALTWAGWYMFFPIYFNRVTGRPLPISDVTLQRPLQDYINANRAHKTEAKRASYPKWLIARGLLTDTEMDELENAGPYKVIQAEKADEIAKSFMPVLGTPFNPETFNVEDEQRALDQISKVSQAERGGPDPNVTATADAIANANSQQQTDMYRDAIDEFLNDLCECLAELSIQWLPEDNAKAIAGPNAVWPAVDRETLWQSLVIQIEAGSTGKPDRQARLSALNQMANICNEFGIGQPGHATINPKWVVTQLLDALDLRSEVEEVLMPPPPPPMMPPPMGAPPGPNGPGPGGPPPPMSGPPPGPPMHHGVTGPGPMPPQGAHPMGAM